MKPRIIDMGELEERKKHYPAAAMVRGISGMVTITATLDAAGRVTDTLIVDEYPNDRYRGFGAAASEIAHIMRWTNPRGRATQVTFRVKFELDDRGAWRPSDACFNGRRVRHAAGARALKFRA